MPSINGKPRISDFWYLHFWEDRIAWVSQGNFIQDLLIKYAFLLIKAASLFCFYHSSRCSLYQGPGEILPKKWIIGDSFPRISLRCTRIFYDNKMRDFWDRWLCDWCSFLVFSKDLNLLSRFYLIHVEIWGWLWEIIIIPGLSPERRIFLLPDPLNDKVSVLPWPFWCLWFMRSWLFQKFKWVGAKNSNSENWPPKGLSEWERNWKGEVLGRRGRAQLTWSFSTSALR